MLPPLNIRAHGAAISALALSPDGDLLATGGLDEAIKMWDAETGRPRRPMQGNGGAVDDMGVEIWDLTTGRQTRKLGNFSSNVQALCFDSKGLSLLAGCEDGEVRQCSLNEPTAVHKVLGRHPGGVLALVLLSSTRLLSAGGDGQVMVWDLEKGTIRGKIGFQVGPIRVLALDRSRNHLLAGGSGLVLRDGQANISNLL